MIPFSRPTVGQEEAAAAARVILSGNLAAGVETEAFEQEFSTYISPPGENYYCIFTNSCTSALKMAYKWSKERYGFDIVAYYPRNTFCATYSAAKEMGIVAEPYESRGSPLIGFRVNMHYGSVKDETPCLIEDSAHRIEPNDPLVGKIRCYSFYATKSMTTGSGGMFVTADKEIYERARLYWRDGLTTSSSYRLADKGYDYKVEAMAGGYDGNDIAASIGRVQLKKLPGLNARRNEIAGVYNASLGQSWPGSYLYPYFVRDEGQAHECIAFLRERGISAGYHYPGTGWNGVSLPIHPLLTDGEVGEVTQAVRDYAGRVR